MLNKQHDAFCQRASQQYRGHDSERLFSNESSSNLYSILAKVAAGDLSSSDAAADIAPLLVSGGARAEDVGGYAKIDHDRSRRTGFPEVVFGEGKSTEQIISILQVMIREGREGSKTRGAGATLHPHAPVVATRVGPERWAAISAALPGARYHKAAQIVYFQDISKLVENPKSKMGKPSVNVAPSSQARQQSIGKVAVLSAGTSDLSVAEEAAVLAELAGAEVSHPLVFTRCVCIAAICRSLRARVSVVVAHPSGKNMLLGGVQLHPSRQAGCKR